MAMATHIFDLHAHYVPHELIEQLRYDDPRWQMRSSPAGDGLTISVRGRDYDLRPGLFDLASRLDDMDRLGVERQAISALPPLYYHWADGALASEMARLTNESMALAVQTYPNRLRAFATVALPSKAAINEARAAITELGLHGFAIGTEFSDEQIDGPSFRALFALASELDVPVFVHPHNVSAPRGLDGSYLINTVGNPMATTIALGRFTFSGILDELPNLRTIWAHLGGYIALALSRLAHGADVRREAQRDGLGPRDVARHIWVDALNHDPEAVAFAARILGRDRIVMGTDYIADMGIGDPAAHLEALRGIDGDLGRLVECENADAAFGAR